MVRRIKKNILIFSTEWDISARNVISFLHQKGMECYLISNINDLNKYGLKLNENYLKETIHSVWYRKLMISAVDLEHNYPPFKSSSTNFLLSETEYCYYAIEKLLIGIKSLGNGFKAMDLNKIESLIIAKQVGLNAPNFLICNNKKELSEFKNREGKVITKPIFNAGSIRLSEEKTGYMYTKVVNDEVIANLPNTFFPSFFQTYIKKEYEIRAFYLDGQIFSAGIFSDNAETKPDYRDSTQTDIRIIPYKLPNTINKQLKRLMKILNLNTGSIDLIKSQDGNYFFLEVNPCGQYESISFNCNYNLNEKIATWLMN